MEEDSDDGQSSKDTATDQQRIQRDLPLLKMEARLSPVSDYLPTPRGVYHHSASFLPTSPSTISENGSLPTTLSTNMWYRASTGTDITEFEDIYDVSDQDDDDDLASSRHFQLSSLERTSHDRAVSQAISKQPTHLFVPVNASNRSDGPWSAVDNFKAVSPVPITPSVQLHMPPALLDFMQRQSNTDDLIISTPPSLDGSLSSEQLAALSAPSTPVIGNDEEKAEETWTGIHLDPEALATLDSLFKGERFNGEGFNGEGFSEVDDVYAQSPQVIDASMTMAQSSAETLQQPLRVVTTYPSPTVQRSSTPSPVRQSFTDLTRLSIPSPGGFFSGLSPRTRAAWHLPAQSPIDMSLPTTATAEQFYRGPWNSQSPVPPVPKRSNSAEGFYRSVNLSSAPIEQVVDVQDDDLDAYTDSMPTARPTVQRRDSVESVESGYIFIMGPSSAGVDEAPTEITGEYDPNYIQKQQQEALVNLGRTELWLLAQRSHLDGVSGEENGAAPTAVLGGSANVNKAEELQPETQTEVEEFDHKIEGENQAMRFSNGIPTTVQPKRLPSKLLRQESAYYRSFQEYFVRTQPQDVFVQRDCRSEALQSQRTGLRETHCNQLLGKHQLSVVPQSAKKRLSANVVRDDNDLTENPEKLRKERELEAMDQMRLPAWHVAALKFLNGGRLISAPVTKRLTRLSGTTSGVNDRARILDLGGQVTGGWAWHCALQYPNTEVATVTTKAIVQLSNSNIRGPPNHRQVSVQRLTRLPFADDHFDLVSARELHCVLKFNGENGEDEWESCLRECMRVLKPGGFLEFSIMDSDIINAGPLGLAKSVEFGYTLKTLGYDPSPSKLWLSRLSRAGFEQVRRAWVCLPVGAKRKMSAVSVKHNASSSFIRNGHQNARQMVDTMEMGSSDNIANVCSLVGTWSWEQWLLRCETEKVAGEMRLVDAAAAGASKRGVGRCLDGVHAILEEGRECKAGFRMLRGYARKPRYGSRVV
ncbi:hypothetical protein E4U48_002425 [Claviceps purpurea]|nr:hypothetical protein E4U48_002425 [Claviceps purpurea]